MDLRRGPLTKPANALTNEERHQLIKVANSPEYANLPPSQIVPKLADKGLYIASESTFYRVLKQEALLVHRSNTSPKKFSPPASLTATKPNQIWSWDITYLRAGIMSTLFWLAPNRRSWTDGEMEGKQELTLGVVKTGINGIIQNEAAQP